MFFLKTEKKNPQTSQSLHEGDFEINNLNKDSECGIIMNFKNDKII